MDHWPNPEEEAFSRMLAFSKNTNKEKTVLFATVEAEPKIFIVNLNDVSIEIVGRIARD